MHPRIPLLCWGLALICGIVALAPAAGGALRFERIDLQPWRAFTGVLVHTGTLHLLVGVIGLFLAGRFLERGVGAATLATVGLIGAMGGAIVAHVFDSGLPAGGTGAFLLAWGGANVMFSESKPNAFAAQCLLIVLFSFASDVKWHYHLAAVCCGLVAGIPRAFGPRAFFAVNAVFAAGLVAAWFGVTR